MLILNSDYDVERAQTAVEAGFADAIAFGRPFIANPDFPKRLRDRLPLSQDDASIWFTQSAEGYTSYPAFEVAIV